MILVNKYPLIDLKPLMIDKTPQVKSTEYVPHCKLFEIPSTMHGFLKPFLKGKILRSSERGVNSILTTILQF